MAATALPVYKFLLPGLLLIIVIFLPSYLALSFSWSILVASRFRGTVHKTAGKREHLTAETGAGNRAPDGTERELLEAAREAEVAASNGGEIELLTAENRAVDGGPGSGDSWWRGMGR